MSTFLSFEYAGAEILAAIDKRIEELKKQHKKAVQEADETYIRKLEEYMHEYIRLPHWKKLLAKKPARPMIGRFVGYDFCAPIVLDLEDAKKLIKPEAVYHLSLDECRKYGLLTEEKEVPTP